MEKSTIEQTASIASAFLLHNSTRAEDVPDLLTTIHDALLGLREPPVMLQARPKPAVDLPWKKTIHRDYLISLVDGRRYKTLRRHLAGAGYTPEEYREAFDLPRDYPIVAAGYSEKRSALAKSYGLGANRSKAAETVDNAPAAAKPKRAKKKAA